MGIGNRVFRVGISHDDKIAAHNSLTLTVGRGSQVELFNGCCFQLLATAQAFLVLAALAAGGRLLVDDPIARLVTGRLHIVALVAFAAALTCVGGKAHLSAGGSGDLRLIAVSKRLLDNSAADGANLGIGAGGFLACLMPACRIPIYIVIAAALTAIFRHTLSGAGGRSHSSTLIEAMPQRVSVIGDKGAAAALAQMQGIAAALAVCGGGNGFISVGLGVLNVGDVAVAADLALLDRIAGADAGGVYNRNAVLMLALRSSCLLALAAVFADIQHLAACLAGSVTHHDALPRMTDSVHIVTLLDLPALHAEIASVAEGLAGGIDCLKDDEVVIVPATLVMAASVAVGILAVAVWVAAATGTVGIFLLIVQPDIGNTVFGHRHAGIGVGDFIVNGILSLFGIVGSARQSA